MGGSSQKQTSTQQQSTTTQLPQWMTDASQQLVGKAMNEKPLGAYNGQMTAGPAANQQAASSAAASGAGAWKPALAQAGAMTTAAASAAPGSVQAGSVAPTNMTAQTQGAQGYTAAGGGAAPSVTATNVQGQTFTPAAAASYMNPYQQQVQQNTLREMDRNSAIEKQSLGDQVQGAKAFGGSRQGVLEAEQAKNQAQQRSDYVDSSNAAAYAAATQQFNQDRGANDALAVGNADRGLQAGTTNASLLDQLMGRIDDASKFTASANNTAAGANADRGQDASKTNAAAANAAATGNADRNLDASKTNASLYETMLDRLMKGGSQMGQIADATAGLNGRDVANLSATGGVDQATSQAGLDAQYQDWLRAGNAPLDNIKDIMAVLSGAPRNVTTNGTSTGTSKTQSNPGLFNQIMGGAQIAGSFFSDRRLKTDVQWLDNLENGLGVYRFRYTWDPADSVPYIGVMAQEVARLMPDALGPEVNGYMTVNYDKIREMLPCC